MTYSSTVPYITFYNMTNSEGTRTTSELGKIYAACLIHSPRPGSWSQAPRAHLLPALFRWHREEKEGKNITRSEGRMDMEKLPECCQWHHYRSSCRSESWGYSSQNIYTFPYPTSVRPLDLLFMSIAVFAATSKIYKGLTHAVPVRGPFSPLVPQSRNIARLRLRPRIGLSRNTMFMLLSLG